MCRRGEDAAPSLLIRFAKLLHCCAAVTVVLMERTGAAPSLSDIFTKTISVQLRRNVSLRSLAYPYFHGIGLTHMLQELHLIESKL